MTKLNLALQSIRTSQNKVNTIVTPVFYRIYNKEDKEAFLALLSLPGLIVTDYILGQLKELIKHQTPNRKFTNEELEINAFKHLGDVNMDEYGVWVHYPWSNRLVHILDEKEFIDLRTSRNQHKITTAERDLLSKKKIGVIGLSVGQSVSVTLAMERICGELRLADFDILELTNLNRIRSGIYNLGIKKVVTVAREIAEIDPFLKVICFGDGLTEENMDAFFLEGGKLDVLIDECDGLDIKILCRYKAKALKIPVVMDTSDRGMIDIERFDLEPDRPILHGLIDHLDTTKLTGLSNEEKVPFILPMTGEESLSSRLKASMLEVEESISTWPQLASAVTLGGGLTTDVSRRILLNQFHDSGRYYVDLESIISDKLTLTVKDYQNFDVYDSEPLTRTSMEAAANNLNFNESTEQIKLSKEEIIQLVNAANTAPSGGNCQPWKWLSKGKNLILYYDKSRNRSFLDYNDVSAYSSLGAAIENLVLKTHQLKYDIKVEIFPMETNLQVVALIKFFKENCDIHGVEPHILDELANTIEKRHTNRNIRLRQMIEPTVYHDLKSVTETIPLAQIQFVDSEAGLIELQEIIASADRIRLLHPQCHNDLFKNEIRWTEKENLEKRDGVDIATIDITAGEFAGFKLAKDSDTIRHLRDWDKGTAFRKMTNKVVQSASAIGFITMPNYNKENFINGGRAWQRMWLSATEKKIGVQPLLVPLMFFIRHIHGEGVGMPVIMNEEIGLLRERFKKVFSVNDNSAEVFLFRLCIADIPKTQSLRLPIDRTLEFCN